MNTAMEMIDKIRDTAQSHDRCSVVEVMGRRCGDIALEVGIAIGASAILVPEVPYDLKKDVIDVLLKNRETGKKHFIIVVVVAEQFQAVFLKISACNSENLTINAPVQHQRHSHIAPVGQCSRRFRGAGEIDVCTRQYFVLTSP